MLLAQLDAADVMELQAEYTLREREREEREAQAEWEAEHQSARRKRR